MLTLINYNYIGHHYDILFYFIFFRAKTSDFTSEVDITVAVSWYTVAFLNTVCRFFKITKIIIIMIMKKSSTSHPVSHHAPGHHSNHNNNKKNGGRRQSLISGGGGGG